MCIVWDNEEDYFKRKKQKKKRSSSTASTSSSSKKLREKERKKKGSRIHVKKEKEKEKEEREKDEATIWVGGKGFIAILPSHYMRAPLVQNLRLSGSPSSSVCHNSISPKSSPGCSPSSTPLPDISSVVSDNDIALHLDEAPKRTFPAHGSSVLKELVYVPSTKEVWSCAGSADGEVISLVILSGHIMFLSLSLSELAL